MSKLGITLLVIAILGSALIVKVNVNREGEKTRTALIELQTKLGQTEGIGQFQVGAYWGIQAVNVYLSQKKSPSIQEVVTMAQTLRAEAIAKQLQEAANADKGSFFGFLWPFGD
jgi:hypothetical protein